MNDTQTTNPRHIPEPDQHQRQDRVPDPVVPELRLGFARGVAPSKWERRWKSAMPSMPLALVPLNMAFGRKPGLAADCDVVIERTTPGAIPAGAAEHGSVVVTDAAESAEITRHAMYLYTESMGLVVAKDHELAKEEAVRLTDISFVKLLDHPDHAPEWPAAEPWADPEWMPKNVRAALQLVATNLGGILLPIPLARHLINKKEHAILPIIADPPMVGTDVWATWTIERDAADVQQLAGILRGRTARSSRPLTEELPEKPMKAAKPQLQEKKRPKLKHNSRGAQLAAVQAKADRNKAIKRLEKRKKK